MVRLLVHDGITVDFLATPWRRRFLFAALYFSEGAPIGFIWLALPTLMKAEGVPLQRITSLSAMLVLPWTFKFAWAPLVDMLRSRWWTLRHWIIAAQILMAATLPPLMWWDWRENLSWISLLLLTHAFAAATQDVAIDALCIAETEPGERGGYNGWMQVGMLLGRAGFGGGALVLAGALGRSAVVLLLMGAVLFSGGLVLGSRESQLAARLLARKPAPLSDVLRRILRSRATWFGLAFALLGGASFKSFEIVYGPYLIDRGYSSVSIGWLAAGPMIAAMIVGSLIGGWCSDRWGSRRVTAATLVLVVLAITAVAVSDASEPAVWLPVWIVVAALTIGLFTAASYGLFMNLTDPALGATQFSAFMGATNGCEYWSTLAIGYVIAAAGYPAGFLAMCAVSLLAICLLPGMTAAGETVASPLESKKGSP